jgi:hypothetical protein
MRLEYLAEGSRDCPLIRLYAFSQADAITLKQLVRSLIAGDRQQVALHDEMWIEPIGGCRLALKRGNRDQEVCQVGSLSFECVLSTDGWSNVEGLLEPFCSSDATGFQWLTHDGTISLLISQRGHW